MIVHDGIGPVVGFLAVNAANHVEDAMRDGAAELEMYAQMNAPWADRTGDARSGLFADVTHEGGEIVITLGHSVEYGQWLELIQEGAFAIIMPTLELLGPDIIERAGAGVLPGGLG